MDENKTDSTFDKKAEAIENKTDKICGVIMPISSIEGCNEQHWEDVQKIIFEAINQTEFRPELVFASDDVGIIQNKIINNLYNNPIAICDVSCKNPNVMFELGMRLAFDKPTIIIKDDKTAYTFDTASIEHLTYPRDLRYTAIVDFEKHLADKVTGTFERSNNDPNYTTFLKHFGTYNIAKIKPKDISKEDYILEELQIIKRLLVNKKLSIWNEYTSNSNPYVAKHYYASKDKLIMELYSNIINNPKCKSRTNKDIAKMIHETLLSGYSINCTIKEIETVLNRIHGTIEEFGNSVG